MKIIHISTSLTGGAGIAAKRHSEAMVQAGLDSKILVLNGEGNALSKKQSILRHWLYLKFIWLISKITRVLSKRVAWHWMIWDENILNIKEVQDADIIYLHWINDFISFKTIKKLLESKKRVIWFMHDMWPITGGCHYSFNCEEYKHLCKNCPQFKILKNLPSSLFKKKIKEWSGHENFYLAAPSKWLSDCIKDAAIFKGNNIFICPNVINTSLFKPMDKANARSELNIPQDKKFILFSATGISNPYKGVRYLINSLKLLENTEYEYLILGNSNIDCFPKSLKSKIHLMGFIKDVNLMIKLYNSADVLVITSLAENFPNVVIEAMSCGIPVVGFSTGGIKDQIRHKINGYIVQPKDVAGIVKGINWVLNNNDYKKLSFEARNYIMENYSYQQILTIHKSLISNI